MTYSKELITSISEAIANTDINKEHYYNKAEQTVIELSGRAREKSMSDGDLYKIEPMLKDILELMEDFALEQDAEDVQERLLKILKNRDKRTSIINFKRVLHDYLRSKKSWDTLEKKWLKERAVEFLDDVHK